MIDFNIKIYFKLLETLVKKGYSFQTFSDFNLNPSKKTIVLRHDVDLLPFNSLVFAKIQNDFGIKGTYYFRAVPESWDESVISQISKMGHEVGYHYESLTTCKGDVDAAYLDFCNNLTKLRELVKVESICMHGSPASKFDSKDLWLKYDYKMLGLIAEPYFDVDFSQVFYLTDTGRCWDGFNISVRDKIPVYQEIWQKQNLIFHSTFDIIERSDFLPDKIMFTFHPQRWNSNKLLWVKELILQNLKNQVKKILVKRTN